MRRYHPSASPVRYADLRAAPRLALYPDRFFDGESWVTSPVVLVIDGRFAHLGPPDGELPDDVEVIRLTGSDLMPAGVDLWTRFLATTTNRELQPSESPYALFHGLAATHRALIDGIGTVVSFDELDPDHGNGIRAGVRDAMILGASLISGAPAGIRDVPESAGRYRDPADAPRGTGPDGYRKSVRKSLAVGADVITADLVADREWPHQDELSAVADEAHRVGGRVLCRVFDARSIELALAAGVDALIGGVDEPLDAPLLERISASRTPWAPALSATTGSGPRAVTEQAALDVVRRGGRIAIGSGASDVDGRAFQIEAQALQSAGLTDDQVLAAATLSGLVALGQARDSLRAGDGAVSLVAFDRSAAAHERWGSAEVTFVVQAHLPDRVGHPW